MTILSKSSNNDYSYVDGTDEKLTVNGNFELDEQRKTVLSANGNIAYDGAQTANFSTSMYNGVLQYQLYGATAENTEKAFKALSGVQEQFKAQVSEAKPDKGSETGAETEASGESSEASSLPDVSTASSSK